MPNKTTADAYKHTQAPLNTAIMDNDPTKLIIRKEKETMPNNAIMTPEAIQEAINELRKFDRIAEDAAAQAEAIKDKIKAHLTAIGKEDISGLDYKITWHTVAGTKFDKKAAEAIHPGIIAACTHPNPYRKFLYK